MTTFVVGGTEHQVPPLTIWTMRNGAWATIQSLAEPGDIFSQMEKMHRLIALGIAQRSNTHTSALEETVAATMDTLSRQGLISDFRGLDESLKLLLARSGIGGEGESGELGESRSEAVQPSGTTL